MDKQAIVARYRKLGLIEKRFVNIIVHMAIDGDSKPRIRRIMRNQWLTSESMKSRDSQFLSAYELGFGHLEKIKKELQHEHL